MKTILIVDDEKNIRQLYKETFEKAKYKVLLAETGNEALQVAKDNKVDLVILDIRLADMNGLEVLERLSTEACLGKPVPLVILNSAYAGYEKDSSVWLAEKYLIKSGDLAELQNAVKAALEKK